PRRWRPRGPAPVRPDRARRSGWRRARGRLRRGLLQPVAVGGDVLVGVLDLHPVTLERAADELAVDDHRLALLEDPAGLAVVADGERLAAEADREGRDAVGVGHGPLVHGALDAQAAPRFAAAAVADLVDVAVVVDSGAEELGDDHPTGDEHEREDDDRPPAAAGPSWRRRAGIAAG